jgi:hypothetical protein
MPITPRLVVELYADPYYRGRRVTLIDSVTDTSEVGANDTTSSIKIYRGPGYNTAPNYKAIFHELPRFQGRKLILSPGYYPNIHEIPYNFGDIISSMSLTPAANPTPPEYGAIPVIIEVFQDTDYQGQKSIILRDVSDMADIGMDNIISSIRIYRGPHFPFNGCEVIFYENPNFEGNRMTISLDNREYSKEIANLHGKERFGDIISSIKIAPMGNFNILVVIGDKSTTEPAILETLSSVEGNKFSYTTVKINSNSDNRGDPYNAVLLSSIDLSGFDIIWFTWYAIGHDGEYFVEDAEDAIKDFVKKGGVIWASAMDDNNNKEPGQPWRGGWLPIDRHPIEVKNSDDVDVDVTDEGKKTGIFTWPHKIDLNALTTDDHWITQDRAYEVLARRKDNNDPISVRLRWGDGYYVAFAMDTRDAIKSQTSKTFMENILCYLASLAWQTSPRQPLKSKYNK